MSGLLLKPLQVWGLHPTPFRGCRRPPSEKTSVCVKSSEKSCGITCLPHPHSPTRLPPTMAMPRETSRPSSWKRLCLMGVLCPEATRGKTSPILQEQDGPSEPAQSGGSQPPGQSFFWEESQRGKQLTLPVLALCLPPPVALTPLHRHLGLLEQ